MDMKLAIMLLLAGQGCAFIMLKYKPCGLSFCVDQKGVTCDPTLGRCLCPKGWIGNARNFCTDRRKHYLCFVHDDPHIERFNGIRFHLPLPCAHLVADLVTPITFMTRTKCNLIVVGRANYARQSSSTSVTYENGIDLEVKTKRSSFKARLRKNSQPEVYERRGYDARYIHLTDNGGFFLLNVAACGILVKYNAAKGDLVILTPIKTIETTGLCGHTKGCEGRNYYRRNLRGYRRAIRLVLGTLRSKSPVDGKDINIFPACTRLTNRVRTCKRNRKELAGDFCGLMVVHGATKHCMKINYDHDTVLDKFAQCYDNACGKKLRCSVYEEIFGACVTKRVSRFLRKRRLCKP